MTRRTRVLLFALIPWFAMFSQKAYGQDVVIPQTNAYLTLARGNAWGNGGACSSGAVCGVNNSYVWSPPTPDSTVCVAVTNNNTTNAHSITLVLNQTLDAQVSTFSSNQGAWAVVPFVGTAFPSNIPAASTVSFFFRSSSAARLALVVSGTTTLGGSPDTANITVVQPSTASFCGSAGNANTLVNAIGAVANGSVIPAAFQLPLLVGGQQVVGSSFLNTAQYMAVDSTSHGLLIGQVDDLNESSNARGVSINNGTSSSGGILHVINWGQQTDGALGSGGGDTHSPFRTSRPYGTAVGSIWEWASTNSAAASGSPLLTYVTRNDVVNPAAGALLVSVNTTNVSNNGLTPHRITVSCSAACDFFVQRVTNAGTTCGAGTLTKTFDPSLGGAINYAAVIGGCVANPTATQVLFHVFLGAGQVYSYDFVGYWWGTLCPSGSGFDVQNGAVVAAGTVTVTMEVILRGGNI